VHWSLSSNFLRSGEHRYLSAFDFVVSRGLIFLAFYFVVATGHTRLRVHAQVRQFSPSSRFASVILRFRNGSNISQCSRTLYLHRSIFLHVRSVVLSPKGRVSSRSRFVPEVPYFSLIESTGSFLFSLALRTRKCLSLLYFNAGAFQIFFAFASAWLR
jgi:hypothetical protein